jgi:hypothetical protein
MLQLLAGTLRQAALWERSEENSIPACLLGGIQTCVSRLNQFVARATVFGIVRGARTDGDRSGNSWELPVFY